MANTGLGATITADAINDFFSLKPKTLVKKPPSCKQLPDNKAKTAEQRRSSDSRDMYSLMSEPNGNIFDQVEEPPVVDEVFEIDAEGLDELEDASQEVKGPDHPALDVYDNYQFDHEYDENLPITKNREWIIGTIEMNQVTIIEGTTGSGKTTQVPQYILDYYREKRQYCNILVTQPRRIAAESIAKRVSEERNWPVGHLVGFQVGRNRNVSEDTRITYMTTGVLLQKMILKKSMNEYTHVILDEVHERDQDIDLAMLVVKKFLNTVSKHVKVILMSATLDCSLFSKYFSVIVRGKLEEAPVVSVGGWAYEVKEYYLDNLRTHGKIPFQSLSEPEVSFECYQLAKNLIVEFDKRELSLQQLEGDAKFADKRGSVLVFLPGYPEIDAMHKHLEKVELERNLQVLILHSQITSIDQSRIFMKPQSGKRKVILSTNIAESSITVPDIEYVIDFCLVKNLETDEDTNYQSLRLRWAAKSSLNQRRGRAGRVASGLCFRLITRDFFARLPEFGTPEMQRCPLQQVVLHVKMLSIGDPCSLLKLALQPPEISDIRKTILLLKEIGALTLMQNDRINPFDGDLTVVGKVLGSLPVDVRVGKLLILGHVFGCLDECLIIAAALSLKSCFARPFKKDLDAYSHKMEWARWSFSDCIAALHCFREWKYKKESSGFGREGEAAWGRKNFVEVKMMHEADQLVKELEGRLQQNNIRRNHDRQRNQRSSMSSDDLLILKMVICGAFYPFYFVSGEVDDAESIKVLSGHDPFSTVMIFKNCRLFPQLNNVPSPGILYKEKIAALMRPCGKGKFLHFENSRCYVEFARSQMQRNSAQNPVLPAVYLAIKMRQLRMDLTIFIRKDNHEDLRRKLESLQMSNTESKSLRLGSLTTSMDGNDAQTDRKTFNKVSLPAIGYTELFVTVALEAGHFWAHYGNQETFQKLAELQHDINAMGGSNLNRIANGVKLRAGEIVLAWFEEEYYRAEVIAEGRVSNKDYMVKIFFLDYGNVDVLPRDQLRHCPERFRQLPYQAFECYLCEIHPVYGDWTDEANIRFRELTQDKKLIAKVYSVVDNSVRVDLYLPDEHVSGNSNHVNQILVDEGFARKCEESYSSRLTKDNSVRMERAIKESNSLLSKLDKKPEAHEVLDYEATKVKLRGPFNPFEMSFYSLTNNGRFRATNIEKDSVNSVFICEEPQDKHPRFMVSAVIGVNATGNTLIARETTVMPNIHGIASIVPVLFAPFAEYRLSKDRKRIIGAICGLGYMESSNVPILPEHDMEVTFDVEFTLNDVQMVNSVRKGINYAFKDADQWGTSALERIQRFSRKRILELLHHKRNETKQTEYSRPYVWNQIPEFVRLKPADEDGSTVPLYALHYGVLLDDPDENKESAYTIKERQVRNLYGMAGRSTDPFQEPVVCPLCNVECRHPRALDLHLETRYHLQEEQILHSNSQSRSSSSSALR